MWSRGLDQTKSDKAMVVNGPFSGINLHYYTANLVQQMGKGKTTHLFLVQKSN